MPIDYSKWDAMSSDDEGEQVDAGNSIGDADTVDTMRQFVVQMVAGTVVTLFQMGNVNTGACEAPYSFLLHTYLNTVYLQLLRDNDAYVVSTFAKLRSHSPVCLIHIFKTLALRLMPAEMPPPDADVGVVRSAVQEHVRNSFDALPWQQLFAHECHGETLQQLRRQWDAKGRPEEQFFEIRRA